MTKEGYNEVPVFYCKDCLSLAVMNIDNFNYCQKCGGTDMGVATIDKWEKIYKDKYGVRYLYDKRNI